MNRSCPLRRLQSLAAVGGFAVVVAALLWPSVRPGRTLVPADVLSYVTPWRVTAGGPRAHNPIVSDASLQFFPWLAWFGRAWRAGGGMPAWNPLILGGVPVSPNGFLVPDYPGFWLARALDPFDAYNLFVAAHVVIACAGVYAFARVLGARPVPAWLAGVGALGAAMWAHWSLHLVHLVGMSWLPLVAALAHRCIERPEGRRAAVLAVAFGLWWLGGNPQYTLFGSIAVGAYCVALIWGRAPREHGDAPRPWQWWRAALAVAGGIALGAALAAPALVPAVARGDRILRSREPVTATAASHLPAWHLAGLAVRDATGDPVSGARLEASPEYVMDSPHIGVAALVLAVAAVASRRRAGVGIAAACALGALVLAFTSWPHHLLYAVVPGYDRFRVGARWCAVFPAFALPLAAVGLDALAAGDRRARAGAAVAAAVVVAGAGWWWASRDAVAPAHWMATRFAASVGAAALAATGGLLVRRRRWLGTLLVGGLIVAEAGIGLARWYPSVKEAGAYPPVAVARIASARGGRILRLGLVRSTVSTFAADVPMAYGVADAQGQAVMFPRDWDRFLRLIDDYGSFARAANTAPDVRGLLDARSPLLDVADVRTVVAESIVPVPAGLRLIATGEPRVYAREGGQPAMLVPTARPATPRAMWRSVAAPGWRPHAESAVVGLAAPVSGGPGEVRLVLQRPGLERWKVVAPQGGFLRVGAAYDPGWTARIDGRPAAVLRADGPFRGVVVPPGRHTVVFRFRDRPLAQGRIVALGGLAVLAVLVAGRVLTVPRRRVDTVQ